MNDMITNIIDKFYEMCEELIESSGFSLVSIDPDARLTADDLQLLEEGGMGALREYYSGYFSDEQSDQAWESLEEIARKVYKTLEAEFKMYGIEDGYDALDHDLDQRESLYELIMTSDESEPFEQLLEQSGYSLD